MNYKKAFSLITFLAIFTSCQMSANEKVKQFKKLDSSLQVLSVAADSNSVTGLNRIIQLKKDRNIQLALNAERIALATAKADKFIDSLKSALISLDPKGERLDIGDRILTDSGIQSKIVENFKEVYAACNAVLVDTSMRQQANQLVVLERDQLLSKNWLIKFVRNTPTVGIVSLLNKIKNDCGNLAKLSLKGVINSLVD